MNIKSIIQNKTFKIYRNFLTSVAFRLFGKYFSTALVDCGRGFFKKLQKSSINFLAILVLIYFKLFLYIGENLHVDMLNP